MEDAARRNGLRRAIKWTGLSALLLISAGAALHFATSAAAPVAPAAGSQASLALPATAASGVSHAATRARTPRPPTDEDESEAPRASDEEEASTDAWLGVVLSGGDDDDEEDGVRVLSVAPGSPAEEAGLRRNDRIVKMDERTIGAYGDISRFMDRHAPGDSVTIVVVRGGSKKNLEATLAAEPRHRRRHVQIYRDKDDDGDEDSFHFEMPGFPEPPEPPDAPGAPTAPRAHGHGGAWAFHFSDRPKLGVSIHPMSEDLRAYFKAPEDAGVLVDSVAEGSAAQKAGMKAGDVIVEVDGRSIGSAGEIGEALSDKEAGAEVDVKVIRSGSEKTLSVTIQESSSPRRRGSNVIEIPGHLEGLAEMTPEVRREIAKSMRLAHEQVREAMEQMKEELKTQKIQIHEQRRLGDEQRQEMQRQLRDKLRELRDLNGQVIRTSQRGVSYDL